MLLLLDSSKRCLNIVVNSSLVEPDEPQPVQIHARTTEYTKVVYHAGNNVPFNVKQTCSDVEMYE
jgi:hypothetical protein